MKSIDEINEELIFESFKTDLQTAITDFQDTVDLLSDLFFHMGDAKIELESWQEFFESQLVRYIYISGSIIKLASGSPIRNFKKKSEITNFDINSLYILARAQIESYLMFYYSQIDISSKDEGEFKYYLYVLNGLTSRQNYYAATIEHKIQREFEKGQIDDLTVKIKNNNYFKSLHPQKANYLLSKIPSRTMGWEELIEKSRLGKKTFPTAYKLYCNYAHAEFISANQFRGYVAKPRILEKAIAHVIERATILTSILIKDMTNKF